MRVWPRSLAARTAVVLVAGLMVVQVAGLTIHAFDRVDVQQLAQSREIVNQVQGIHRAVVATAPDRRATVLASLPRGPGVSAALSPGPPVTDLPEMALPRRRFWLLMGAGAEGPDGRNDGVRPNRPFGMGMAGGVAYGGVQWHRVVLGFPLPGGGWLNFDARTDPPSPWLSPTFMAAFGLMTCVAAALTFWAVRRLTAPVRILARAAEALGRDVNAPPLPENGPLEIATAAVAFNTMAGRIRRFVDDRTALLAAIGHDLRTPITRMKLRAEFMDDDELRAKMLADLEEMQAMVAATLAFGRDARTTEPLGSLDLVELIRTILDETGDANPGAADRLRYDGPAHLPVKARSLAMKRALTNLIANAVAYGGAARVRLSPPAAGLVTIAIEDDGPGIPPAEMERVFEPFHRIESSRNRETGGTGLGLPIARDIMRAHGGDVTLANRAGGGLRATVTLPV